MVFRRFTQVLAVLSVFLGLGMMYVAISVFSSAGPARFVVALFIASIVGFNVYYAFFMKDAEDA